MTRFASLLLLLGFCGCALFVPEPPDYTIKVTQMPDGSSVAVPPDCAAWTDNPPVTVNNLNNLPLPQYGCANARNLALMVEQPQDLVDGRDAGPANPVNTANTIRFYHNGATRGLLDPAANSTVPAATTAPAQAPAGP